MADPTNTADPGFWLKVSTWLAIAGSAILTWIFKRLHGRVDNLDKEMPKKVDGDQHRADMSEVKASISNVHDRIDDTIDIFRSEHKTGREQASHNHSEAMKTIADSHEKLLNTVIDTLKDKN